MVGGVEVAHHEHPPAANYVNWLGRTVGQVRQEARLQAALSAELGQLVATDPDGAPSAEAAYRHLKAFFDRSEELHPSQPAPTPIGWQLANQLHFAVPIFLFLLPWVLAFPHFLDVPAPWGWVMLGFAALGAVALVFYLRWVIRNPGPGMGDTA